MKKVPFIKYTSYGNNFVIVDETQEAVLSEAEKSRFGYLATNTCFGVGSDNLLLVQRCDTDTLSEINEYRRYWQRLPDSDCAEYLFRMFEPDGTEALCCGNGLMCIADYLARKHGVTAATIMTEIPLSVPRVGRLGQAVGGECWVDLGRPRRLPDGLIQPQAARAHSQTIDLMHEMSVKFRNHDLAPYTDHRTLSLEGYLVFTGEPHLVLLPDRGLSQPQLLDPMFLMSRRDNSPTNIDKRAQFGSWLIHRIGCYLNTKCQDIFKSGININFARVDEAANEVEYRCFERGINRETLACGTGALAVAFVASQLGKLQPPKIDVLPHRCRWHVPEAKLHVTQRNDENWMLSGRPDLLFEGCYALHGEGDAAGNVPSPIAESDFDRPAMPSGNYIAITDDAVAEATVNR
jgi:diaminopimelate epimerase